MGPFELAARLSRSTGRAGTRTGNEKDEVEEEIFRIPGQLKLCLYHRVEGVHMPSDVDLAA